MMKDMPDSEAVKAFLMRLQDDLVATFEKADSRSVFSAQDFPGVSDTIARPRVLEDGKHIEKGAIQFTHSQGSSLPAAATDRNPELKGRSFEAISMSVIIHPRNPYAPTMHSNLRFFLVHGQNPHWYFGGGFDLTPYYGFIEDVVHWHMQARLASGQYYEQMKEQCDKYFYLPHRAESRGVGGLFFDDWKEQGFQKSFELVQSIGNHIVPAYLPILKRRKDMSYSDQQREWQLYRRGRYAEFNLAIDRGTKYGMQTGRRIESVLASLPPLAAWKYEYLPAKGSPEEALQLEFLKPRDWLAQEK